MLTIYGSIIAVCIGGGMLIGLVGPIFYRDFRSYTLAGNPFDHSSFPWYEIDSIRLMAVAGIAGIAGIFFVPCYVIALLLMGQLFRHGPLTGHTGRALAATLALLVEMVASAWFDRLI